jgi:hypothetical protein
LEVEQSLYQHPGLQLLADLEGLLLGVEVVDLVDQLGVYQLVEEPLLQVTKELCLQYLVQDTFSIQLRPVRPEYYL